MKINLIDDWRDAYKYLSVQAAAAIVLIAELQDYLPELQAYLPHEWYKWIAVAVIVSRVISQKKAVK